MRAAQAVETPEALERIRVELLGRILAGAVSKIAKVTVQILRDAELGELLRIRLHFADGSVFLCDTDEAAELLRWAQALAQAH